MTHPYPQPGEFPPLPDGEPATEPASAPASVEPASASASVEPTETVPLPMSGAVPYPGPGPYPAAGQFPAPGSEAYPIPRDPQTGDARTGDALTDPLPPGGYQPAPGAYQPGAYQPGAYQPAPYQGQPAPYQGQPAPYQPAPPPGVLPPGAFPPGAYPAGGYPPGAYPPGAYPPGPYPPQAAAPYAGYPVSGYPVSGYPVSGYPGPYPGSAVPASSMPGYPGYGYPYPQPPVALPPAPKRRGLWIGLGAGLLVLVLLGGVATAVLVTRSRQGLTATAARPSSSPSARLTPTATPASFKGDLRTLLVPIPTAGAKLANTDVGSPDGTISMAQAAERYKDAADASTYLQSMGYAQGATESWRTGETEARVILFQFYSTLSERWLRGNTDFYDSSDKINGRGDLPGIPGGRYYVYTHSGNEDYLIRCFFTKYDLAADIYIFTPQAPDPATLTALAQQQFALLP